MTPLRPLVFLAYFCLFPGASAFSQSSPIIVDPPSSLDIDCGELVPPPIELTSEPTEECGEVSFAFSEYHLCIDYKVYALDEPSAIGWGMYVAYINWSYNLYDWAEGARLYVGPEQAFLVGDVIEQADPSNRFSVFIRLETGRSWEEWSSLTTTNGELNRQYRSNLESSALDTEPWTDWRFYEVDGESSQLSGQDGFSGSSNRMFHQPESRIYGAQIGAGGNSYNLDPGLSIWSGGLGFMNGGFTVGRTSIYADLTLLGSVGELYCNDVILRSWTATNECNLRTTTVRTITTSGGPFPADVDGDGSYLIDDLIILNSAFDTRCTDCRVDINGDGMVDIVDFLLWNTAYGAVCD